MVRKMPLTVQYIFHSLHSFSFSPFSELNNNLLSFSSCFTKTIYDFFSIALSHSLFIWPIFYPLRIFRSLLKLFYENPLNIYEILNVTKTKPSGIEESIEYYMIKRKLYETKTICFSNIFYRVEFQLFKKNTHTAAAATLEPKCCHLIGFDDFFHCALKRSL